MRETRARFFLDLHTHTADGSDDAGATVDGYLRWISGRRRSGYRIDGFVLTEHRAFDPSRDYGDLAARHGLVVLRGVEVETDRGHVLVYGVSDRFYREFDLANVALPHRDVFRAARDHGGIAVAAHAGRPHIGLADYVDVGTMTLDGIEVIEALNGGSSDIENAHALHLAERHGLRAVGGSDAHFTSRIARCLTAFAEPVRTIEALVEQLRGGEVWPVDVEETHDDEEVRARSRRLHAAYAPRRQVRHEPVDVELDRSVIGVESAFGPVRVTREQIATYCAATGDRNPLYLDDEAAAAGPNGGIVAPPGLLSELVRGRPPDARVRYGNISIMAGSRLDCVLPVRPGDEITAHASVKDIYGKTGRSGTMVFVVTRTRFTNQRGEEVGASEHTSAYHRVPPSAL